MTAKLSGKNLESRLKSFVDRDIRMISKYVSVKERSHFQCLKLTCGRTWISTVNDISNGRGCAKCSGKLVDPTMVQERILKLKLRSIKLLSNFQGSAKLHDFECAKSDCGYRWTTSWDNVVNSSKGCARCAGRALTDEEKATNEYRTKIRHRISNLYKRGCIDISIHRDDAYMSEVLTYCQTQVSKLPKKPSGDEIWNLDHIIPITKFDHTDIEQVKLCWDYRNLQWLLAKVNGAKWSKLMPEYFTEWHYEVLDKLGLTV